MVANKELNQIMDQSRLEAKEIDRLRNENMQLKIQQIVAGSEKKFEEQLTMVRKELENKIKNEQQTSKENLNNIKQSAEFKTIELANLVEIEKNSRIAGEQNFEAQLVENRQRITALEQQLGGEREARIVAEEELARLRQNLEVEVAARIGLEEEIAKTSAAFNQQMITHDGSIKEHLSKITILESDTSDAGVEMGNISIQQENICAEISLYSSVILLGGWNNAVIDLIYIYNSRENSWQLCRKRLPYKVGHHGSVIIKGNIYFFGGDNGKIQERSAIKYRRSTVFTRLLNLESVMVNLLSKQQMIAAPPNRPRSESEIYKSCYKMGEDGEWTKMADMTEKRTSIANSTVIFGSEIWVIGGSNKNSALETVEKYDPHTNIWTKMPNLKCKREDAAASVVAGKIYISGGWDGKKRLKSVEVYDPIKGDWEIFCKLPVMLAEHCSTVIGTNLVITGGYNEDVEASNKVWKIDVLDPKKEWIQMPKLKTKRSHHGAVRFPNGMMVFGGMRETGHLSTTERYEGREWTNRPELPEKIGGFSCVPLILRTETQLLQRLFKDD